MPNYYLKTTGQYYFSGMYTAILPMIPGIYAIYRLLRERKLQLKLTTGNKKNQMKLSTQKNKQREIYQ